MLDFEDRRWKGLKAGYRTAIDLRPILRRLEADRDQKETWHEAWQKLYHQGDVGEGSFVAVPHLVRIHRLRGVADWNTYAIVTAIELARGKDGNPDVPAWSRDSYNEALLDLGLIGLEELPRASNRETVRSILGLLAIVHGARTYGRILVEFTEDEILELEKRAFDVRRTPDNQPLQPAGRVGRRSAPPSRARR
jgi:hypothetical protein